MKLTVSGKVKKTQREFVTVVQRTGRLNRVCSVTVYHMETSNFITVDCEERGIYKAKHLAETMLLEKANESR